MSHEGNVELGVTDAAVLSGLRRLLSLAGDAMPVSETAFGNGAPDAEFARASELGLVAIGFTTSGDRTYRLTRLGRALLEDVAVADAPAAVDASAMPSKIETVKVVQFHADNLRGGRNA